MSLTSSGKYVWLHVAHFSILLQVVRWCCWFMNMCLDGYRKTGEGEENEKEKETSSISLINVPRCLFCQLTSFTPDQIYIFFYLLQNIN